MANTLKQLGQIAVGSTISTLYTVPASTLTMTKEIIYCNTGASVATLTVYFVASGDSPAVKNTILSAASLLPGETQIIFDSSFLNAGATIQVVSDTPGVIGLTVSGVEMGVS